MGSIIAECWIEVLGDTMTQLAQVQHTKDSWLAWSAVWIRLFYWCDFTRCLYRHWLNFLKELKKKTSLASFGFEVAVAVRGPWTCHILVVVRNRYGVWTGRDLCLVGLPMGRWGRGPERRHTRLYHLTENTRGHESLRIV